MREIEARINRLREVSRNFRHTDSAARTRRLKRLWQEILRRQEDLFEASYRERRSHRLDMAAELAMIKAETDFTCKHLARWMKPEKIRNSMGTLGKRCAILYQPRGVVLNFAAFNAPTAESFIPMIAAIAAGNVVALKPSELAPHSAQIIAQIVKEALVEDEADVFTGGVEMAEALLACPVDHIYYTGGMAVGRIVMKAAAAHFASVTLEMGGKSPVIVDQTADLENAATKIAWGRVMNAGQVCIAPEYVIAHDSIKDRFSELVREKIIGLYDSAGTGFQTSDYVPRIINEKHTTRIKALIDDATAKGAKLLLGGGYDIEDHFIEPTILTDMTEDMQIMHEEVFGPVLSILSYTDRSQIIDYIDRRPNPLALYVYSKDEEMVDFILTHTSSGSAVVNNNCIQSGTNPRLAFGGVGRSGMGRIGGFEGFKTMSNARSLVYQPLDRFRDFLIQLPPYSERYTKIITNMLK